MVSGAYESLVRIPTACKVVYPSEHPASGASSVSIREEGVGFPRFCVSSGASALLVDEIT